MKIFYKSRGKMHDKIDIQDTETFQSLKNGKGLLCHWKWYTDEQFNEIKFDFGYSLENLIDGSYMFFGNNRLNNFNSNLEKLENGYNMFANSEIITFESTMLKLVDGSYMFYQCGELTSFNSDLSSLICGDSMFCRTEMKNWDLPLSKLVDGEMMFYACNKLTSFSSDLSSLINGDAMFSGSDLFTAFNSNLSNLLNGHWMFRDCKLNETSLRNIADTINDVSTLDKNDDEHWKYELLGKTETISWGRRGQIDIDLDSSVTQEVIIECGNTLIEKGWDVYFNDTLYEYTTVVTPYDVSEANGYIPDAYKNGNDSWNTLVLKPKMDELQISTVNEKGEMLKQ